MKNLCAFAAGVTLLFSPAFAAAADGPKPIRHLEYSFTWGIENDTEERTSGIGAGGSGIQNYRAELSDKGNIFVDVLKVQPDNVVILSVSEKAQEQRSAPSAKCAVYPDTTVTCAPDVKVNPEELTVVRFLGVNFVDPTMIDAKQHWQFKRSSAAQSLTADYQIKKNDNGVMAIDETRNIDDQSGAQKATAQVTTSLTYDYNKTLPTWVSEYTIERGKGRIGQDSKTISQIEVKLISDSGVKQP